MARRIPTLKTRQINPPPITSPDQKEKKRFLNSTAWKRLRKSYLQSYPICECDDLNCERYATEVHHKIDRAIRPDLALDWDNLQAMSKSCHSKITRERQQNAS